jgi:hypothetical protein
MKFLKVLCVVALVFAVSTIAYAETQSVKVSGDIAMNAFARDNYNLHSGQNTSGLSVSNTWATFLQSCAEVQVDADLTDNVSGVIRLVNQRVWGDDQFSNVNSNAVGGLALRDSNDGQHNYVAGGGSSAISDYNYGETQNSYAVNIDLAYIELKEFLYSPLTLRIGRQDLWFGRGFIIGANMQTPGNTIFAQEYTAFRAFDAIRATLDYDPWTIDFVYSKISEEMMSSDDDVDLWGANVGYVFDSFNADAEAYWFWKRSRNPGEVGYGATIISIQQDVGRLHNDVHTFGARTSFDPIDTITINAEAAYQTGNYILDNQQDDRVRSAWAVDAGIEVRHFADMFPWKPVIGLEFIYYSGEEDVMNEAASTTGKYGAWDKMFRGKFDTAIREYQEWYYSLSALAQTQVGTPGYTNELQILVRGSIEPTDSLTIEALYGHFWLDKNPNENAAAASASKSLGDEVDITVTYDYTEDVSFNILAAWFFPGKFFVSPRNDCAADVVGTVKLSF